MGGNTELSHCPPGRSADTLFSHLCQLFRGTRCLSLCKLHDQHQPQLSREMGLVQWDGPARRAWGETELTVCPRLVVGWVRAKLWSSLTAQPAFSMGEAGESPSAHGHSWRAVRQTHSRLSRPWFTFRALARASAPPSPMLLLENLQERRQGELVFWSSLAGWGPGSGSRVAPQGCASCVALRVPSAFAQLQSVAGGLCR